MKKEVIVHVKGVITQKEMEDDAIEIYSVGNYFFKDGSHYLLYEESLADEEDTQIKNTIKINQDPTQIIMTKKGKYSSRMIFTEGHTDHSVYQTPFGGMSLNATTSKVDFSLTDEFIRIEMDYDLQINYADSSRNKILIEGKFL
ncbi:DUF1934 domain-containing protein [Lachnospiraceae bacterium TWA4]|nr:DUF1934 domain-containing protein [Lachnospiraceae bacterium TWA4]